MGRRPLLKMMNPLEWVAFIHEKLFTGFPWAGYLLAGVISLSLGLLVWARGVDKYREQQRQSSNVTTDSSPPASSPSVPAPISPPKPDPSPKTSGAAAVTDKDKPTSQTFNVTSHDQRGGVTAGQINISTAEPKVEGHEVESNRKISDDVYESRYQITVSKAAVSNLYVEIEAPSIFEIEVASMVSTITETGHSGHRDGFVFANIPKALGPYMVTVRTRKPEQLKPSYNVDR